MRKPEIFSHPLVILTAALLFCFSVASRGDVRELSLDERIEDCATEAVATALHKARAKGQSATPETGRSRCFKTANPHPKVLDRCLRLAMRRCESTISNQPTGGVNA